MCKQLIIAISGRKSAGKNVLSTFISQYYAYRKCYPYANFIYDASKSFLRTNETLYNFIQNNVGMYSFADTLKEFCIETLGLERIQCYGTDEQKNTPTQYKWEDVKDAYLRWKFGDKEWSFVTKGIMTIPIDFHPLHDGKPEKIEDRQSFYSSTNGIWEPSLRTGFMTAREVMQLFGTDLIRHTFGNVWASSTIRRIKNQRKPLALISDHRFIDESEAVLRSGGYILRLTRTPFGYSDSHESEAALDNFDWNKEHCFVIDNQKMSEDEQNKAAVDILETII